MYDIVRVITPPRRYHMYTLSSYRCIGFYDISLFGTVSKLSQ